MPGNRPLAFWLPILLVALVALVAGIGLAIPRTESAPAPSLTGTLLGGHPAPSFALPDQYGHRVTLRQFRGKVVVVTFLESQCREICPLVAETLSQVNRELGSDRGRLAMLAISTAPEEDTPASIARFSRQHGLSNRWRYLNGGRQELSKVWAAYHIFAAPASAPTKIRDSHTAATYIIDPKGRERVLMTQNPDEQALLADIRILAGLPITTQVSSVPAPFTGHPAPALGAALLASAHLTPVQLKGHVILVNFWATWCKPCRSEMPRLDALYRSRRRSGLIVLGVDHGESHSDVTSFVARLRVTYPVAVDTNGEAAARYGVAALPTSFIIDGHGVIVAKLLGIVHPAYLANHLVPLLRRT